MARILFFSWWWPYPANNGSKVRNYHLLRGLSRKHQITLLSFAEEGEALPEHVEHLRQFCAHVEAVPKPTYHPSSFKAVAGYLSRWPRSLVDVYSPAMAARVQAVIQQTPPDVAIASEWQTMRYLSLMPDLPVILEGAEITIFKDRVQQADGRAGQFRARLTLAKLEDALRRLAARGGVLTVVSEKEQMHIRRVVPPRTHVEVIPNGVDTAANCPDPAAVPQPHSLIYTGAVTYSANLDAVGYFVRDVWPLVRKQTPQARFTVTGGTGSVDVSALAAQPGVSFSGYLEQLAPVIQANWALVVPLRTGGGTRLKILEAMALGVPVISTTKGAEGLNVHPGRNILIADQPEEMAEAIHTLFADPDLRARLAAAGRALVEREYDWTMISCRLHRVVEALRK